MMQEIITYLLKSSGLIMTFFVAYYFLLRKETFFTTNRWFLLSGLLSSVVLPLFFIKKIVLVEAPKIVSYHDSLTSAIPVSNNEIVTQTTEIDWIQIGFYIYGIIAAVLLLKIIFNLLSLYKVLRKNKIQKQQHFQFIDTKENVSPFSFFNYIVINSSLYSESELQSILLHEKIHSAQKHSLDVILTNLFTVIFWFNPFIHLYKKALLQNLEYIADSEAIAQIDDKKAYQMALIKVVSNQNCLPITNHFYQSLIKKRIVMLNKNQSHKKNSWKYAVILPALIAFVILFQVKVIAQQKAQKLEEIASKKNSGNNSKNDITTNSIVDSTKAVAISSGVITFKNTTDEEMKKDAEDLKKIGINYTFSKVKRNSQGEIVAIKIEFDNHKGSKGATEIDSDEPIEPIYFNMDKQFGKIGFTQAPDFNGYVIDEKLSKKLGTEVRVKMDTSNEEYPVPPTPPTPPTVPSLYLNTNNPELNFPKPPKAPSGSPLTNEKQWKKYEEKMEEYGKKIDAMSPQIEAYAKKMSNVEAQMKPYEQEMEAYEKKMNEYEKQMEEYEKKIELYMERKNKP